MMGNLISKIIDNLEIDFQDLHVRIEFNNPPVFNTSFGVKVEQIEMINAKDIQVDNEILKKLVKIQKFNIYF